MLLRWKYIHPFQIPFTFLSINATMFDLFWLHSYVFHCCTLVYASVKPVVCIERSVCVSSCELSDLSAFHTLCWFSRIWLLFLCLVHVLISKDPIGWGGAGLSDVRAALGQVVLSSTSWWPQSRWPQCVPASYQRHQGIQIQTLSGGWRARSSSQANKQIKYFLQWHIFIHSVDKL